MVGIKLQISRLDCISSYSLHFGVDMLCETYFLLLVFLVQIFLELAVRKFVALFMFAIES